MSAPTHSVRLWLLTMSALFVACGNGGDSGGDEDSDGAPEYVVVLGGRDDPWMITIADDASSETTEDVIYPPPDLPFVGNSTSVDGAASVAVDYELSRDEFLITFSHSRSTALNSNSQAGGAIYFVVDQDINYTVSGTLTAADPEGLFTHQAAELFEYTLGRYVFRFLQTSVSIPNESFTVGLSEGDQGNILVGSLTGTLIAEQEYVFTYQARLIALPTAATSVATASGFVSLKFAPIP